MSLHAIGTQEEWPAGQPAMKPLQASSLWHCTSRKAAGRSSRLAALAALATVFCASAAATYAWCGAMADMGGMPMPGGWMMSMMRMPMCGQNWPGLAASFLGMWTVMMAAMMLPSLSPVLWRYRQNRIEAGQWHPSCLAAVLGLGYLFAWTLIGLAVLACGGAFAAAVLGMPALARAVPIAAGLVILTAGALQFTAWKARHLACWGDMSTIGAARQHVHLRVALLDGLRLGLPAAATLAA